MEEAGGGEIKNVSARFLVVEAHARRRTTAQSTADMEEVGEGEGGSEPSRSTISSARKRGRAGSKPIERLQEEGKEEWEKKIRLKCQDAQKNHGASLMEEEAIQACEKDHWRIYAEVACTLSSRRRVRHCLGGVVLPNLTFL